MKSLASKDASDNMADVDQMAFYKGQTRVILNQVKAKLRVFFATVNLFPTVEQLLRFIRKTFPLVCAEVLGEGQDGKQYVLWRSSADKTIQSNTQSLRQTWRKW